MVVDLVTFSHDFSLSGNKLGKDVWRWMMSMEGSPIAKVFMGMFKCSRRCDVCSHISLTFDPYWDMGLPIAKVRSICVSKSQRFLKKQQPSDFLNMHL